ncbi:hypothetical protein HYS47_01770 [Candidatus Woesearchaeota archaeon]|nr:hypothetical protein [Candidatus Woesearchaeota archaeon]
MGELIKFTQMARDEKEKIAKQETRKQEAPETPSPQRHARIRRRFCPKCGIKNEDGELCSNCRVTDLPKKLMEDSVEVKYCTACKRYLSSRVHVSVRNISDVLQRQLRPFFSKGSPFQLDVPEVKQCGPGITEEIIVQLHQGANSYSIPVFVCYTTCSNCGRKGTDYFEGVLQLRHTTPDILARIRKEINRRPSRGFVTKEVPVNDGIDLYLTSQTYLQALGQKLLKRFGGELKASSRIFGHDRLRSRDVYRRTVLLILPSFGINEVIVYDGKLVKVTRLGKSIRGVDLRQKKTVTFIPKEQPMVLQKHKVMVAQVQPGVHVIHPETFQPVLLHGIVQPEQQLQPGQKVVVVFYNHACWFVK